MNFDNLEFKKKWILFKRNLEKIFYAILFKYCPIVDIEKSEGQIGYTTEKPEIHLAYSNELFDDLEENERLFFIQGVFAHELLHQAFSDFNLLNAILSKYKNRERNIVAEINNILEDPAIEYFAPSIIGGKLLKSLKFSIFHIWKKSPDINESDEPFCQFLNALIQFGDMGLIKGYFTSNEAKKIFNQAAPLMIKGIKNPNPRDRIQIAEEIMELSRPLWESKTNSEFDDLMEMVENQLSEQGKNGNEQSGSPLTTPDVDVLGDDSKTNQREKTLDSLINENSDENSIDSKNTNENNDLDNESLSSTQKKETQSSSNNKSNESKNEDLDSNSNSESKSETKSKEQLQHDGDLVRNDNSLEKSKTESNPNVDFSENLKKENFGDGIIDFDKYEITEDDINDILKSLQEESHSSELNDKKDESKPGDMIIEDISSGSLEGAKCLNKDISGGDSSSYQHLVNKNVANINLLHSRLKRIFDEDRSEKIYKTSGKINLRRMNNGTPTSRIFTKNIDPKNKANCSICLVIDESGSMGSKKSQAARDCAIILAETCKKLHIPIYIMGFTTGMGYDAIQNHYVKWKNTYNERVTLTNIASYSANFDGYSIRYGGKLLEDRPEDYKLLIVISDGCPSHAINGIDAKSDVRNAVKDISKYSSVLGVSIQNNDYITLQHFYGNNFIHINEVEELPINFVQKIKKIIKDWE